MALERICVLTPAFNTTNTLLTVVCDGNEKITSIRKIRGELNSEGVDLDLLIINDGSREETGKVLTEIKSKNDWVEVISNDKNRGVTHCVISGYNHLADRHGTNGEQIAVVRLDSDGEHDPRQIIPIYQSIRDGADGAFSQLLYNQDPKNMINYFFDRFNGAIQGSVVLGEGQSFQHNSPGFNGYRLDIILKTLPLYTKYLKLYEEQYGIKPTWGVDISFLFCARLLGANIDTTIISPSTISPPNRTTEKMLVQSKRNLLHLELINRIKKGELKLL